MSKLLMSINDPTFSMQELILPGVMEMFMHLMERGLFKTLMFMKDLATHLEFHLLKDSSPFFLNLVIANSDVMSS